MVLQSATRGVELEGRVQKLLLKQGYSTMRNVFLREHVRGASNPDIDVLGVSFGEDFLRKTVVCDCKSGQAKQFRPVNRVLWLQTLARRIHADRIYLVALDTKAEIRLYALKEGVHLLDQGALERLEQGAETCDELAGSAQPSYLQASEAVVRAGKDTPVWQIARVLSTEFWFSPACASTKRVLAQYEQAASLEKLPGFNSNTLKWVKGTLIDLFIVGVLRICEEVAPLSSSQREDILRQRLVSDRIPYADFTQLVRTALEYANATLGGGGALPKDIYTIPPPAYTESLLDLVTRALQAPKEAVRMPLFSEYVLFNYVLEGKPVDHTAVETALGMDYRRLQAHYRDYVLFLDGIASSTRHLLGAVLPGEGQAES